MFDESSNSGSDTCRANNRFVLYDCSTLSYCFDGGYVTQTECVTGFIMMFYPSVRRVSSDSAVEQTAVNLQCKAFRHGRIVRTETF